MLEAYKNHPDAFTSSVEERAALPMEWWASRLNASEHASEIVIGAFNENELIGVVGVSFETRAKIQHKSRLFGMYVKPDARQHGIGKALVLAALKETRLRPNVAIMQLTVTDGNQAARKLYESFGFTQFGLEPYAVSAAPGAFLSKVHMWCNLQKEYKA